MARELGVSEAAVGQLVAAAGLAGVALGLFAGPLSDRHGRRLILLVAAGALAVSSFGSAVSQSYSLLLASRFGAGIGSVLLLPAALAAVGDFVPERQQSRAIGAVMAGTGLSLVVGWPLASLSSGHWGWRSAFVELAALFVLLAVLLLVLVPSGKASSRATGATFGAYRALLSDRGLNTALLSNALAAAAWFAITTYLGVFLGTRFSLVGGQQAPVLAATGACYALGSGIGGLVAPRFGPVPVVVSCAIAAAVLSLTLPTVGFGVGMAVLLGLAALRGIGITVMTSAIVSFRPTMRGAVSGLNAAFFSVGVASGAAIGGVALSMKGLAALFAMVSALSGATALVLILGRRSLMVRADP
jgi:predicted MFS family arabinose efflux permease